MSELVASPCIEQQFHRVVQAIEQRLQLLDRLPRVRINAWLKKLKEEVSSNVIWQRNRNCYARLLLEQLRAGCLEVPFNTMPPEGALPTLPVYLTYRFLSPPKVQQASTCGSLDDRQCYSSSCLFGYDQSACRPMRPLSAGAADSGVYTTSPTLRPLPASGAHDTWRVMWGSAPTGHAGLSALAPGRSGSPPRQANIALQQQQQQQWLEGSPCGSRSGRPGSGRRGYASSSSAGSPQRPVSPGAAGLLDAAAVVAAELQAEQVEAERMNSRLRFAEDKLLQQEAELVRLQGAASAARRRIKTATAATLQELLDRYSSAAAVWQQGGSRTASPGSSVPPALADAVYKPVWQLLSGLQSVLDSCDQEEAEWLRAKGSAAAAAAIQSCYEAQAAGGMMPSPWALEQQQQQQLLSAMELGVQGATAQQQLKGAGQVAAEGAAAAAAEATVLQQCEGCLAALQQHAEVLAAELGVKKDEATAAAGGRGPLAAAAVAQATAKLLRPMLKLLKQEGKDASKLRRRLEAAAEASDAAAVAAAGTTAAAAEAVVQLQASLMQEDSDSSSGSSDSESESDASSSSSASSKRSSRRRVQRKLRKQQRVLQVAEQQQQLQGARLMRLQSASQLLMELDKAAAKLDAQLRDAQQRLLDMAASGGTAAAAAGGALLPLQHHDNGLIAAATAGIAASLSAGLRAFQANVTNLGRLVQSLRAGAAAAAGGGGGGGASPGSKAHRHRQHEQQQQQRASGSGSSLTRSRSSPGRSVAAVTLPVGDAGGYFSRQNSSGGGGGGSSSSPGRLGRSISSRLGDAALAGTWGEQPPSALPRSPKGSTYDAAAHYLIGAAAAAAAAAGAGSHGRSGGGASSIVGGRASLVSQQAVSASVGGGVVNTHTNSSSSPTTPRGLGPSKAAFTEHLQGSAGGAAAAAAAASAGGSIGGNGGGGGDAAAEAVHAQLAGLSRQASRLSVRASQLSMTAGSAADSAAVAAGGSSPGTAAAAAAGGGGGGLLSTGALRALTGSSSFSALQRATGATLGASSTTTAAAALSTRPLTAGLGALSGGAGLSGAVGTLQGLAANSTGLGFSSLGGGSLSGGAAGGRSLLSSATRAALLGPGGGGTGSTAVLGVAGGFASSVGSLSANRSPLLLHSGTLSAGGGGGGGSSGSTAFGPGGALSVPLLRTNAISSKLGGVSNGGSLAAISSRLQSLTGGR